VILTTQALASEPIHIGGNEEQKKTFLYRLASGKCLGALGITEAGAGSMSRDKDLRQKGGWRISAQWV